METHESSSVEAVARKGLMETVIDCSHYSVCQSVKCSSGGRIQAVNKCGIQPIPRV
jgi:hypothetical protein